MPLKTPEQIANLIINDKLSVMFESKRTFGYAVVQSGPMKKLKDNGFSKEQAESIGSLLFRTCKAIPQNESIARDRIKNAFINALKAEENTITGWNMMNTLDAPETWNAPKIA